MGEERSGGDSRGPLRRAAWLGVFALALGLRLTYLVEWHRTVLFSTPIGDSRTYLDWAREIAGGNWFGSEVFYQAPLYPYFLAALFALTGSTTWAPRLVQAVGGALAAVLIGRATERSFGRAAGLAAGIGLAVYAPAIYFDGLIQKASLDGALLSGIVFVLSGATTPIGVGRALAAGALLGLLGLSRENALVLVPVVGVWVALLPGARPVTRAGSVAALVLGVALVLVPVGLRNQTLGGRFLLTTSQLGPNLWIGNHPGATGKYEPMRPGHGGARWERDDARALAEADVGRALSPAEVSDYWVGRVLRYVREQPLDWLRLTARKWLLVWNAGELPDTEGIEAYTQVSWLLRALFWVFHFGVLAPLALVGALSLTHDWRRSWLLPAMALALASSVALFFVFARYRYALVPVLMPLAAVGAVAIASAFRRGRRGLIAAAPLAAAGVAAAVFANWPLPATHSDGLTHYSVGSALLDAGDLASAQQELERAVSDLPNFAAAHSLLGDALRTRGEPARALASYDRALQLDPSYSGAHSGRGMALEALGRPAEAAQSYERALQLDPNDPFANTNLGNQRFSAGDVGGALAMYERAHAADPDQPSFEINLGAALARSGDRTRALELLNHALTRAPRNATALINRAVVLESLGRVSEARGDLSTVLSLEPADSPYAQAARAALARLDER